MTLLDPRADAPAEVAPVAPPPARPALARCVGDADAFLRDHWSQRPLLAHHGAGAFDDLLSADDVDALLGPRNLRVPGFTMVKDGETVPASRYTRSGVTGGRRLTDYPDSGKVAELFATGTSVVLQALHRTHPPLADFTARLAEELGHQVQVNVYVTPPGARGFRAHHDTHDVLVLQLDGEKHWTVREPLVDLPLASQPSKDLGVERAEAQPVAITEVLRPGDALYLPRGWLHEARTSGTRSVHLTIGLLQTTWYDVLNDLLPTAGQSLPLRRALPADGAPADVDAFRAAVVAWAQQLGAADVEAAIARRRARAVPPEPVGVLAVERFRRELTPEHWVRPRRGVPARVEERGDQAVLVLRDREVAVPGWVATPLRAAVLGPSCAAGLPGIDAADGVVLLRRLLLEGAVVPLG